jgi:hypothetical protein
MMVPAVSRRCGIVACETRKVPLALTFHADLQLHLIGDQSYAVTGQIAEYQWAVEQPLGSVKSFQPSNSVPNPTFQVNVAGTYAVELQVWDEDGTRSCLPASYTVFADPDVGLHVELTHRERTVGNIYRGVIKKINPAFQAAFVDYGEERNGFLPLSDVNPALFKASGGNGGKGRPRIQQLLKEGQSVMVQVLKEGMKNKGSALTTYISLPGRYLVLTPNSDRSGVSRHIDDPDQRARLPADWRECAHLLTDDAVYSCGEAMVRAYELTGEPPARLVPLARRLPGYDRAQEGAYRFVAAHRDWFGRFV